MGTETRWDTISGPTLEKAFEDLQEEDGEDRGKDVDSGSWYNSEGVHEVSAEKFDAMDSGNKYEPAYAKCIKKPIGNTNKIKTDVVRYPNHGTRKWETVYEVVEIGWPDAVRAKYKLQADAITDARNRCSKNKRNFRIDIAKHLVGKAGDTLCAKISYKKSSTERDGIWEIMGGMSC
jgi:hypothetical protein